MKSQFVWTISKLQRVGEVNEKTTNDLFQCFAWRHPSTLNGFYILSNEQKNNIALKIGEQKRRKKITHVREQQQQPAMLCVL